MDEVLHIIKNSIVKTFLLLFDWAIVSICFIAFNPFTHLSSAVPLRIHFHSLSLALVTTLSDDQPAPDPLIVAIHIFPSVQLIQGMR
jgi:hypothetical protein